MGLDASIYGQIQQPKFESPMNALAQMSQIKNAQNQNRLADLKFSEAERTLASENSLRDVTRNSLDPVTGKIDATKMRTGLAGLGDYKQLNEFETNQATQVKATREAEKASLEQAIAKQKIVAQYAGAAKDQASWTQGLTELQSMGIDVSKVPQQFDPQTAGTLRDRALTGKEQLEQKWKAMEYTTPNANAVLGSQTSLATNAASNATSRANNAATVGAALRGQNLTDARSREANAQPKGQIVQTDQGTMLVNPRDGTAQPVTAGGQALQPKLKDMPGPMQKSLIENSTSLRKIDQALAAIDQYPAALGLKNYLGDGIRQRSDPTGVEARALVADIGSLKIHDRSGAAVTASETPRLKPFIPAATDDPATVKKKLNLFKQEYEAIQSDITSTYTREQGYRPPTVTPAGGLPSDIDALLKKHGGK